jgi:predicted secreted Zn-dependent protease
MVDRHVFIQMPASVRKRVRCDIDNADNYSGGTGFQFPAVRKLPLTRQEGISSRLMFDAVHKIRFRSGAMRALLSSNSSERQKNASMVKRPALAGLRRSAASVVICTATAVLASCTSVGERTNLSVGYYSIQGESFAELDQQIALHGPLVAGVGKALAATNVQMIPDFHFSFSQGACRPESAHVRVKAHVTLPKLASPDKLRRELSGAWDNLEQYARLHEAVHVAIADRYAIKAEKAILALPPEKECSTLRSNAAVTFRRLMAEHERDQLQFDEDEKSRIAQIVSTGQQK